MLYEVITPSGNPSFYSSETDFDLAKAVTDEDIATLSQEDIVKLNTDGKISDECLALIKDIDIISRITSYNVCYTKLLR